MDLKSFGICVAICVLHFPVGLVAQDDSAETSTPKIFESLPIERFDPECYKDFGGPNFFAWVVRISVENWFKTDEPTVVLPDHYIATGNIITEDYVLTACTPFVTVIEEERWDQVRVLPALTEYSTVMPIPENGTFPWALPGSTHGCIVGHYHVYGEVAVTDRPCDAHSADYPNVMSNNLILLHMASRITVGDYKLFPRMPFNYNLEPLVRKIDWFNTFRKARCVIGRIKDVVIEKDRDGNDVPKYTNLFEGEAFHYASLPFKSHCIAEVCQQTCSALFFAGKDCILEDVKKPKDVCKELEDCWLTCLKAMEPYIGTLMCLTRMHENELGGTQPYSITYDFDNKHTPYEEGESCLPYSPHPATADPIYMGAPVVCDGEVIAVVTKCQKDFLIATSIVSIRHRLLKLFDTSYEKDLVYLTEG